MTKDILTNYNPYFAQISRALTVTIVLFVTNLGQAQGILDTRWYFGNSTENLVFDLNGRGAILETTQAIPFGSAGAITITDQFTGNLLFYSDGTQVFDASHTLVPNPNALNGDATINVPIVTVPVGGSPGQYYLFTNQGALGAEIEYSIVDATQVGNGTAQFPLGDLTVVNQPTGLTDPAEAMLIIPAGDGETFWLLSQDQTNFNLRVTELNTGGIGATTPYGAFIDGTNPGFIASHFAFNQDSLQLVVAPQTANRNIWLFEFDPATGVPLFEQQLIGTGFDDGSGESIYDVEWSGDGSKLYLSRFGGTGDVANIYQIDFNDTTLSVNPILQTPVNRSYGLQRAIDDRIYHLYQEANGSQFSLGRINRPDSLVDSVNYEPIVFDVDWGAQQFPSFTPAYDFTFDTLNFTYIDSCFENVTKFFPIIEPVPQNVTWDFGDGGGTDAIIPIYTYMAEGGYMVSLTAEIAGISQTVTRPVEILTNDLMVDLGNDTTICVDEILTLDAGMGDTFVWNTGALTQTIDVDTAGTYWVEVTSTTGCTDFDDIEVTEYGVANQVSNQWYFGEQAGIEFTGGAVAITDGNIQMAEEGCATISDVNGELLFYTNGVTVFNREHDVMINGDLIGGEQQSAQNSLILPFNGDETMFYLFTTESVYGDDEYALRYTIVDMKEDESRGAVVVKNIKLMDNSTERVTASGFTGTDALLAHEFGNNNFKVYNTNGEGLSGAIFSPVGEIHEFVQELSATGYMKFSPNLEQIAVNIPGTNQLEILDFDATTGEVSNPRLIETGETDLYGLEFSNTGNRLYLTTSNANSKLIQYDLDSLDSENPATDIEATKFDGYPQGPGYGALQTGPDGIIYMAVDNSGTIGTITGGDADDLGAGFNASAFDLAGRTSRLGLPNFAQNQSPPLQTPSITVTGTCFGQPTSFSGTGRDNSIEFYRWVFGDGQATGFSQTPDTTYTYSSPGTYTVELQLMNRCDVDTSLFLDIEIFTIPESPTVPADTALCDTPIVLEAWPVDDPNLGYFWSTGDTTRQITVPDPALIDVAIVDLTTGCTSDTLQIFVAEARPTIDLGPDLTLCQNDPVVRLDSQIPNATYVWSVNGVPGGTNRTFDVATDVAGSFEYTVAVTNSFGCTGRDTVQVTILEQPVISTMGNATLAVCGSSTGSIDITFGSLGSFSYVATGPTPFGPTSRDVSAIPDVLNVPNLLPGSYTLTVTNIVTGCENTQIVLVPDFGSDMNANPTDGCIGDGTITLTNVPASFSYRLQYEDGSNADITGTTQTVFNNLDTGTWFVTIQDLGGAGCIETDTARIELAFPQPNFTFDAIQELCENPGDVAVTDLDGANYDWAGPGGFTGTGTSVSATIPGTYTVTASGPAFCPRSEDIEVIFNGNPAVDVTINGDPCEGQVVLIANVSGGSGTYVFDWSDGSQAQQNTVTSSGTYTVTVVDQLTSCSATSAPVDVTVEQEFNVVLTLEPNCEDNGEVFLIATTNFFDPDITYEWRNGAGDLQADTDSILSVTVTDTYSVLATNAAGTCTATDQFSVAVIPINPEELTLPERATFCTADADNPTVTLDPGIWNTYEWRLLPDETIISTDPTLTVSTEGTYEVTIFNGFTCITDQVQVVEDCSPVIFAPNAFSPNGNGQNEEFFVFPNEYVTDFEIFIYSRWGELIFFSNTQDFRWDGTFRGSLLPVGTYAYIMKFSSLLEPEVGTIEQYGSVTLVR